MVVELSGVTVLGLPVAHHTRVAERWVWPSLPAHHARVAGRWDE